MHASCTRACVMCRFSVLAHPMYSRVYLIFMRIILYYLFIRHSSSETDIVMRTDTNGSDDTWLPSGARKNGPREYAFWSTLKRPGHVFEIPDLGVPGPETRLYNIIRYGCLYTPVNNVSIIRDGRCSLSFIWVYYNVCSLVRETLKYMERFSTQ